MPTIEAYPFHGFRGMKPEYLILEDFDFDITVYGYNEITITPRGLDGATRFIKVSGPRVGNLRADRFFQLNTVVKTLNFS